MQSPANYVHSLFYRAKFFLHSSERFLQTFQEKYVEIFVWLESCIRAIL